MKRSDYPESSFASKHVETIQQRSMYSGCTHLTRRGKSITPGLEKKEKVRSGEYFDHPILSKVPWASKNVDIRGGLGARGE